MLPIAHLLLALALPATVRTVPSPSPAVGRDEQLHLTVLIACQYAWRRMAKAVAVSRLDDGPTRGNRVEKNFARRSLAAMVRYQQHLAAQRLLGITLDQRQPGAPDSPCVALGSEATRPLSRMSRPYQASGKASSKRSWARHIPCEKASSNAARLKQMARSQARWRKHKPRANAAIAARAVGIGLAGKVRNCCNRPSPASQAAAGSTDCQAFKVCREAELLVAADVAKTIPLASAV